MRFHHRLTMCVLAVLLASPAFADNAVRVESKDVCAGQDSITIGIYITNDVQVRHLILPLELRAGDGLASISSIRVDWGGRLPAERGAALGDNIFSHLHLAKDCECPNGPGYGSIASTEAGPHKIDAMPLALLLSRLRFVGPDLMPGSDSTTASITLTVDVRSKPGEIVLDTACICPNHRLTYVHGVDDVRAAYPEFTKGVITVGECKDE